MRTKYPKNTSIKTGNRKITHKAECIEYQAPDLAIILSLVYLGAPLPSDPSLRAAMADYMHSLA